MLTTETLRENEWQVAHNIAIKLANDRTDVNELEKVIAYLRTYGNSEEGGSKLFSYLKILVKNGDKIGHSQQTKEFYISIEKACKHYLQSYQSDTSAMLQILGWASRLMRYYKKAGPIGEIAAPTVPTVELPRQTKIAKVAQSQALKIDQILDAKVTKISGNKVTYEILGTIKLTEKEPKKASLLKEGQIVQIKITALKDDGSLKNVKCVDVTQTSPLYQRLVNNARAAKRPLEEIMLHALKVGSPPDWDDVPDEFQADLAALDRMENEALWKIACSRKCAADMSRYNELLELGQSNSLTPDEKLELMALRSEADRFMLCKAQAAALLRWRGHNLPTR